MADIKFTTWQIKNQEYSHPYVLSFDFMLNDNQIYEIYCRFEGRYDMRYMGKYFYFRHRAERCECIELLTHQNKLYG